MKFIGDIIFTEDNPWRKLLTSIKNIKEKGSQMVTYAVVNIVDREKFEKKYFLPYGYVICPIFTEEEDAIDFVERLPDRRRIQSIVEKIEGGEIEVVYRGEWFDPSLDSIELS